MTFRSTSCLPALAIAMLLLGVTSSILKAQPLDRALQADRVDQNLGQLDPVKKPLDSITGLRVRPEGITEVDDPAAKKGARKPTPRKNKNE